MINVAESAIKTRKMRMDIGRRHALLLLCGLLAMSMPRVSESTCATFAAWLRSEHLAAAGAAPICGGTLCSNLEGFATITVAPDAQSITVTLQVKELTQSLSAYCLHFSNHHRIDAAGDSTALLD